LRVVLLERDLSAAEAACAVELLDGQADAVRRGLAERGFGSGQRAIVSDQNLAAAGGRGAARRRSSGRRGPAARRRGACRGCSIGGRRCRRFGRFGGGAGRPVRRSRRAASRPSAAGRGGENRQGAAEGREEMIQEIRASKSPCSSHRSIPLELALILTQSQE